MKLARVAIFIAYELFSIIVHVAVYATLAVAFGIGSSWLWWAFIVLAFIFVGASALSHFKAGRLVDVFYMVSAYWFGLVPFLFGGGFLFYIASALLYGHNIYIAPAVIGAITFGAGFLLHLYGTWNCQWLRLKKITVELSKHPGFDAGFWKGKSLVFVSDLQLGNIYREAFTAKVAQMIEQQDPYAVLIGGDLYDGVQGDEAKLIAPLTKLHPPGGTYFVSGNHEYYLSDPEQAFEAIRKAGIKILKDEKAEIGGIDLFGVDYQTTREPDAFKKALDTIGIDRTRPSILMRHVPDHLDVAEAAGISLDLSGHTHRGQFFPIMFITRQMYKGFDYGLKWLGAMQVYTSSGAGTWGPPLRLGTSAEVVAIEFV